MTFHTAPGCEGQRSPWNNWHVTALVNADAPRRYLGRRHYSLSDHLGNVLGTVLDRKIRHSWGSTDYDYWLSDVATAQDYYPFGMYMKDRIYQAGGVITG